jgi:glycosyltransferase involved in cell wall biosynthesis
MPAIAFSICMPIYNGRALLEETLQTIANQTHGDWELIVIEDASPEPSRDIVEAFAARVAQRVRYEINPQNIGPGATRERILEFTTREHIAFVDSDDLWQPEHLAILAQTITRTGAEFVCSGFQMFNTDLAKPTQTFAPDANALADLSLAYFLTRYWILPSAMAMHRGLIERHRPWTLGMERKLAFFGSGRDLCEDRNFFVRVMLAGTNPVYTGHVTAGYRRHEQSMTMRDQASHQHRIYCLNLWGTLPDRPQHPQRVHFSRMNANAAANERSSHPRRAAYFYFMAWRWRPIRIDHLARAMGHALRAKLTRA